jgi:hypothetical protein
MKINGSATRCLINVQVLNEKLVNDQLFDSTSILTHQAFRSAKLVLAL